jgi:tRNA-dihydrouridine synthase 1
MPPPEGKQGFKFYREVLKDPKYVVAPMVDASELAWRMLARRYGAQLCYTPMWHSAVFIRDEKYRKNALQTCPEDRPLIVQFCANDPDIFRKAVNLTVNAIECDAIDLNLGCPQVIARRGHFGSFLQDEWDLISKLVSVIHDNFSVPVTCKIRVFDDVQKTIDYAKMMESAGCQVLTVHGRTRDQKGALTGLASWDHIKAVVNAVNIPVVANGNIQNLDDVHRCIDATGVSGVMSAEGHLTNPALFSGLNLSVWQMGLEYLDLVDKYPCPLSYARGHLFKLLHHVLQLKANVHIRDIIAKGHSFAEFRRAVEMIRDVCLLGGHKKWLNAEELSHYNLKFPPWICQPYVRPPPEEHLKKLEEDRQKEKQKNAATADKRPFDEMTEGPMISKRKMKKLERNPHKKLSNAQESGMLCVSLSCPNPSSKKCVFELCKQCCRTKCFTLELDCNGHQIWVKTKRENARKYALSENDIEAQ